MKFKSLKNALSKIIGSISVIIFIIGNLGYIRQLFDVKEIISEVIAVLHVTGIIFIWSYIKKEFIKKNELISYYQSKLNTKDN